MGNGTAADAWKTMLVILLLIVSILAALFVVQVTSLWDWFNPLTRKMATWSVLQPHVEMYRHGREEWGEVEARIESLEVREMDLQGRYARLEEEQRELKAAQNELELEQDRLTTLEQTLERREAELAERETGLASLDNLREVYAAMRPQEAAAIMSDMEPSEIASLLNDMPPRQASAILAALPREKAATVSRLFGL